MVNAKIKRLIIITILILSCFGSIAYAGPVGYLTSTLPNAVNFTPDADVFRFDKSSEEYILLDYDEEGFFVTTKGLYGVRAFGRTKFDLNDKNNIAYWLNNDFIHNGNADNDRGFTYRLCEVVKKHIIEHDWVCEAGHKTSSFPEDFVVRAKLALMSLTEYKKYADKIGTNDNMDVSTYYYLRTVNGTASDNPIMVMNPGGTTGYGKNANPYGVRPVFYLERSAFLEDKLNMKDTGDNVKAKLREVYSLEELSKTYNSEEIEGIYAKFPPKIEEISMSGAQRIGKTLTVKYKYFSIEGEEEGKSIVKWLRSKTTSGPYSEIKGVDGLEYTITREDAGYYISCKIIPISKSGLIGVSRTVRGSGNTIKGITASYAEDVKIIGEMIVGGKLIASYKYVDNNDSVETGTVVKWQKSSDNTNFIDIEGQTTANLIVPADCAGQYIRCIVTTHNEIEAGASVVSESIGPIEFRPEQVKPEIELANGKISLKTSIKEQNRIVWLTQTENGKMGVSQYGSNEYVLNGTETAVKAMIVYYSNNGIMCGTEESDVLSVGNAGDSGNNQTANNSIRVSGGNVKIVSVGAQPAYSLKIVLSTSDVKLVDAKSDEYDIYSYESEGQITYVLTKKTTSGSAMPNTIIELTTEGSGEIKIEATEAVYDGDNGKIEKYEPKLSLVGGNV